LRRDMPPATAAAMRLRRSRDSSFTMRASLFRQHAS
jgi:hypothetical protein